MTSSKIPTQSPTSIDGEASKKKASLIAKAALEDPIGFSSRTDQSDDHSCTSEESDVLDEAVGIVDSLKESKAARAKRYSNRLRDTASFSGGGLLDMSGRFSSDGSDGISASDRWCKSERSMNFDRLISSERSNRSEDRLAVSDRLCMSERSFRGTTSARNGAEMLLDNSDRLQLLMSSTHLDDLSTSDESDMDDDNLQYHGDD